jgi:hypothetical protein
MWRVRVRLVHGALPDKAGPLGLDEVVLHDVDAGRPARIGAVLAGSPRSARRGCRSGSRPAGTARWRAPPSCSAPSAPGSSRGGWSTERPARARRAGPGDDRTRWARRRPGRAGSASSLRTIRRWSRSPRRSRARAPGAWMINFTSPGGMVTEAVPQVLWTARWASATRRRGCAGASPARRAASATSPRSSTSDSTTSAGSRACATAVTSCSRRCSPTTPRARASRRGACSAATGCRRSR